MSQKGHPFPASMAWLIDGPLRRWIQPADKVVEKLALSKEMNVMDFGCGIGYFTVELVKHAGRVVGVDVQTGMLSKAKRKVAKAGLGNVEFLLSNGASIQMPDESADLILLVTVYHEIGNAQVALAEFLRILKPSGRLVIVEVIRKGVVSF